MEFKGTKGEWLFISSDKNIVNPGRPRVITNCFAIAEFTQDTILENVEIEANAKLIAAAPEVTKQLQLSNEWLKKFKDMLKGTEYEEILKYGIAENEKTIEKALK